MAEKLVRDRVHELILESRQPVKFRFATPQELPRLRRNKLREEMTELGFAIAELESGEGRADAVVDEMADVAEVVRSMGYDFSSASSVVEARRVEKKEDKGGFEEGVVIEF